LSGKYSTEDYDSVVDMFNAMHEDFIREHPIRAWIDKRFKGVYHWSASYSLMRPDEVIAETFRRIKWGFQRMFRGWDDTVIWSIDSYLAKQIPVWFEELKKSKPGTPMMMFNEDELEDYHPTDEARERRHAEYLSILDEIADGFRCYTRLEDADFYLDGKIDKKLEDNLTKKYNRGMELFVKYFGTYWD